jgi:hypothetical protein
MTYDTYLPGDLVGVAAVDEEDLAAGCEEDR